MADSLLLKVVVVASPFINMAPLYEVDPDADVLLIVPPNTKPFAPWDEPSTPSPSDETQQEKTSAALKSTSGLRIKASSKHLALASRVFRNKLHHGYTKTAIQSDGRIHLSLAQEFDPKAVSIVLNAIHSRGSKVPRSVDLDTLAQIAHFVDRFQLFDAVEVYADRWISSLSDSIASAYDRDLVLWLHLSHVFRRAETFNEASRIAVAHSTGPLRTLGLPLRESIIRDIDAQRQALVAQSIAILHSALDDLTGGKAPCPKFHCDSFLLGELIKTLHRSGLVWPRPEKPFSGVSHASIVEAFSAASGSGNQWAGASGAAPVDFWGNTNGNGNGVAVNGNKGGVRKRKSPNAEVRLITPESSPEPVARAVSAFDTHECEARKLVGRFDELDGLESAVRGLELASVLGYQRY